MTVNLGTWLQLCAMIILAPSLVMPAASYDLPTM